MRLRTTKATAGVVGVMVLPLALAACGSSSKGKSHCTAADDRCQQQRRRWPRPAARSPSASRARCPAPTHRSSASTVSTASSSPSTRPTRPRRCRTRSKLDQSDDQGTPDQGPTAARKLVDDKVHRRHRPDVLRRHQGLRAGLLPGRDPVGEPVGHQPGAHHARLQDLRARHRPGHRAGQGGGRLHRQEARRPRRSSRSTTTATTAPASPRRWTPQLQADGAQRHPRRHQPDEELHRRRPPRSSATTPTRCTTRATTPSSARWPRP